MSMRHAFNLLRILTDPRIVLPALREFRQRDDANGGLTPAVAKNGVSWRRRLVAVKFLVRWLWRERLMRHRGQWVVGSYMPPFPGRAYERFFSRTLPGQRLIPHSAFLALTSDCPANCWHCSLKGRRLAGDLTTDQWLGVIDQLQQLGVCFIAMTGGEPTTREDLPRLVRAADQGGAAVEVFTCGIGLTAEKIDALCNAGLWAIGVSLDHTDPDRVNRLRGTPKAFDAAVNALDMSRRAGLYTFINAVVDREAVARGEHRRLYDLACRLRLHELRLLEPMPCGRLASVGEDCRLTPEQITELRRFHRDVNRRARGPKICAFPEIESPELFGCGAGTFHLHIDPSGNVCPCDFVPLSFGNVLDEPLEHVVGRMGDAMRQPRRHCFLQTNAARIHQLAAKGGYPLSPGLSAQVAAESPEEPLPDYFEVVARPFGLPFV
jgi:MoaA/NifB/PqqE/SkfB family radical SAM enzyme